MFFLGGGSPVPLEVLDPSLVKFLNVCGHMYFVFRFLQIPLETEKLLRLTWNWEEVWEEAWVEVCKMLQNAYW